MKTHQITLKPRFDAYIGEKKVGTFRIKSEWEGLANLVNDDGAGIIVSSMLVGQKIDIVKASPSIALEFEDKG